MSDLNPCPLCHNPGDENGSENFWDIIVLGQNGGALMPHATVSCNRCGLQVVVFWCRGVGGKPVKDPARILAQPALDEAKRRWNAIPPAPVPFKLE